MVPENYSRNSRKTPHLLRLHGKGEHFQRITRTVHIFCQNKRILDVLFVSKVF